MYSKGKIIMENTEDQTQKGHFKLLLDAQGDFDTVCLAHENTPCQDWKWAAGLH